MARLPSKYDLSGPVGMRSGRVIASADQSAIGRGLASFGQSLAAIGEDRKRSNLALEATQADGGATGALYDLERSFENETDYQNFGQRFETETQKIKATQGAKITDPLKRKLWEAEFDKQKQAARDRVLTLGQNREKENFAVLARDSLMEYQRVFADPDVPAEERNRAKASADASIRVLQQEGVLSPEKASEWRKAVIEGGEFIFAQREIERNPGVISAGKIASGPVGQVITDAANRYGVSPDALMRVAMIESGGNPAAKNPNSSAGGLFQFIDSTARQYGLSNKFDAAQSADAAARLMRDNATYLRKTLNREPTAGELYLAHQQGAGGAAKLLANPNALAVDVIGYEAVRLNGGAPGMTAGQFAEKWTRKMDGASAKLPDWYTNADADTQLKYEEMARRREKELAVEGRTVIETAINNAPTAIINTGAYTGYMPSINDFVSAYGPQEGADRFNAFTSSVDTAEQVHSMQTMSSAEILATVEEATPTSSGTDAALEQNRYDVLSKAASTVLKAREDDPANYVRRAFPSVDQAWADLDSEGGYQRAIAASVAAQQQLGVTNIQPLPKTVAESAAARFKDISLPEGDRIGAISNVMMATEDPTQRKAIFEQMVKAGLPEITEGAFRALERGDAGAAQNLFTAAMVDVSTLPGKIDATPEKIDDAVQSQVMDDGMVGDIFYGLSDGSVESFIPAQRDSKLLSNAVNLRMRKGETLEQAVDGAAKDLFGDVQPVVEDNVKILLPANEDPDVVVAGLQALMPQVERALEEKIVNNGTRRPFLTNPVVHEVARNQVPLVMSEGYFRNAGDGYVFIDPYTGDAVSDMNDQPIIFRPVPEAELPAPVSGAPVSPATDPAFEQRTPETGAGPSLDENGNPVVLGQ